MSDVSVTHLTCMYVACGVQLLMCTPQLCHVYPPGIHVYTCVYLYRYVCVRREYRRV